MNPNDLNLWQRLDHFYQVMSGVQQSLQDPQRKQMLGELLEQFRKHRAEAEKTVPALVKKMETDTLDLKTWCEGMQKDLAAMQKDVDERLKAEAEGKRPPPAPAPAPAYRPAPDQAAALSQELLTRFAAQAAKASDRVDEGSVSKHWEETSVAEAPAPKTPAAPARAPSPTAPPAQPKKPPAQSDDVSDLSTRSWDEGEG